METPIQENRFWTERGPVSAEGAYNGAKTAIVQTGGNMENGKREHCCPICGKIWPLGYHPKAKVYCGQCAYSNCKEAREALRQVALASSNPKGWKILW